MSGRDARKRALAGRIFWASVEVRVRHGTRPQTAARPLVTLQTILHYSAGYSSRLMEFFEFKS
jgi:hypothetical protein